MKVFIEEYGGKVLLSVFKKIIYLFVGEDFGSKLMKVEKFSVMVIDEEGFLSLI